MEFVDLRKFLTPKHQLFKSDLKTVVKKNELIALQKGRKFQTLTPLVTNKESSALIKLLRSMRLKLL